MAEKKFTFTHDGKTYELPPYVDSVPKVPGGVVSDLLLVSTWVRTRSRACRGSVTSLIRRNKLTANDERFALAA